MSDTSEGIGGLKYDKSKKAWPNEFNVFLALIIIILIFEALGQLLPYMKGQSMLFDFNTNRDGTILNMARIKIMILQVAIIGIISLGVTQVIISGGIDLSSGPLVGASAMIVMSFAQTEFVNGQLNPKAVFEWAFDMPVLLPILVGACLRRVHWGHKWVAYCLHWHPTLYRDPWYVPDLPRHRAVVDPRPARVFPDRVFRVYWFGYDACCLVSVTRGPVPLHPQIHGLWQTYLRHRIE